MISETDSIGEVLQEMTFIPSDSALSKSILSVPTPNLEITFNFVNFSSKFVLYFSVPAITPSQSVK